MIMNIFFLVRTLDLKKGGGSHFNAVAQIRLFRSLGHSVEVHTFREDINNPPEDISIIKHSCGNLGFLMDKKEVEEILKSHEAKFDIFFLYGVDFLYGGGLYRKNGGTKPVAVYLDTYLASMSVLTEHPPFYRLKRKIWDMFFGLTLAQHVDKYFSVSPYIKKRYIDLGFPKDQFDIFPNFFSLPKKRKNLLSSRVSKVKMLYVGRLTFDKGIDMLLHALYGLKNYSWELHIVGDGPLKEWSTEFVKKNKLCNRVFFTGWVDQKCLPEIYTKANLFVHPARWPEPFGRTVVEALLHNVPVIVPEEGGSAWIAGPAGLTFKNGDIDDLTRILENSFRNPAQLAEYALLSLDTVVRFSEVDVSENIKISLENLRSL
ncbi:MAG: hypothetical protein COT80_02610 [Candidatus Buchananbacteria bacterium CG10_big_fil_rev_8_21_14_0_10_33_19]|uniref:Uncharacterized protein n=1 Tax=Candidatus Buchananbacteria bacterium CG10_big_fil_rev_8_21_14_0_10_33_19 TaxID=1974525 RepID=A0A2H0W454_9BACT|nr:MAG: hypothetical protein COT80_02610 [Candidatus Buchananbacteria bacterium CG10_big_fil_rev_8_21_14_0_10_33_19]